MVCDDMTSQLQLEGEGRKGGRREIERTFFFSFSFLGNGEQGKIGGGGEERPLKAPGGERRQSKFNAGDVRMLIGQTGIFRSCGGILFRFFFFNTVLYTS